MNSQIFLTIGILGGLMVMGGLAYITIGKSKILDNYEKNLHDRATLLRSRKTNKTRRKNKTPI